MKTSLCKYSKILGIPGKGIHTRVFGIAIIDVLFTILGAFCIQKLLNYYNYNVAYLTVLLCLFLAGIILHRLFCVRTTIDKLLFG